MGLRLKFTRSPDSDFDADSDLEINSDPDPEPSAKWTTQDQSPVKDFAAGFQNTGKLDMAHFSADARKVYQCLREYPQSDEGVHVREIGQTLDMYEADILRAAEELLDSGYIYTTVDDDTWAVLDFDETDSY